MLDPIGGFRRIQDFFISYIETNFRIADPSIATARRKLLNSNGEFAATPYIEPVLRYESSPQTLEELADDPNGSLKELTPEGRKAFVDLVLSGLFDSKPGDEIWLRRSVHSPYIHQVKMLERGIQSGTPGIVTSGTGSGKTESFMLPILASLANEAVRWAAPKGGYLQNQWWSDSSANWVPSRNGEKRSAAVRALVLYPMNALVEDQMARLRKTLDSDDAREVMKARFNGNQIFFGQYTSSTPVTGYAHHPRLADDSKEKKRRTSNLKKLRKVLNRIDSDQYAAREFDNLNPPSSESDRSRYIFPSTDGGEMVSRWDMQAAPPDILVTNASMLGAMLAREVEDDIFDLTREWLMSNDDAYFYLVFDELHLMRGSAGTETAMLLKSLIMRLGLDKPKHRYKLRLLASSASLPMDGMGGEQSRKYLRDLFAPFGTYRNAQDVGSENPDFWCDCVIEGRPFIPKPERKVDALPFAELMRVVLAEQGGTVRSIEMSAELNSALFGTFSALGVKENDSRKAIKIAAEIASALLTNACIENIGDKPRAMPPEVIVKNVFLERTWNSEDEAELALRGMMLLRALPDSGVASEKLAITTPAFRVHTFVRNIEGFFAAVLPGEKKPQFSDFCLERGMSHAPSSPDGVRGRRLFEMLYCEACGDLLIGGQTGQGNGGSSVELLPSATNLENLPERPGSEYYDDMTLEEFAVFWPVVKEPQLSEKGWDVWQKAVLNPVTGIVTVGENTAAIGSDSVSGYLYFQRPRPAKKNEPARIPSAQPFCCPNCGIDYSNRPVSNRNRSPIRAFRTGVTKASQLVATELFELLHAIGAEAKSIVFSDSRQDAASMALEIERLHLRDLRREILVASARSIIKDAEGKYIKADEIKVKMKAALVNDDLEEYARLHELQKTQVNITSLCQFRRVKIERLFESKDSSLSMISSELAALGISPYKYSLSVDGDSKRPWHTNFVKDGTVVKYDDNLSLSDRMEIKKKIVDTQLELIDDAIFANTFFALEETGLAYPCISERDDMPSLDAWLRVFAGVYRIKENKYFSDENAVVWNTGRDITKEKIKNIASTLFGSNYQDELSKILELFTVQGHPGGLFNIGKLYLKVAKRGEPYWQCCNCGRVHLHIGFYHCTRCGHRLPAEPSGVVETLWENNFLGKRIVRGESDGVERFRLNVEELTGQTDDFSDRLRKFKGIFVGKMSELEKLDSEIDMLAVTTTMEVGIDIGSLQSVYQANMPPQRFNYQQRVGRAGRRGQAFSFVITFCRGRTHDAYYFAHPHAITGDSPPPPFLAVDHDAIPLRLMRKVWLRSAFRLLREEDHEKGVSFPGDKLIPPDVHGEYVSTYDYYSDAEAYWAKRLHHALESTEHVAQSFIDVAVFEPEQKKRLYRELDAKKLISDIDKLSSNAPNDSVELVGLARFLAEHGILPMYGMPTRVRNLYLGLRETKGLNDQAEYEWSIMDRDLDLAVFEYAPGSVLIKDKKKHEVIGLTGNYREPQIKSKHVSELSTVGKWFESSCYVATCPECGSAKLEHNQPVSEINCTDCTNPIGSDEFKLYVTPTAFRTDFNPKDDIEGFSRMSLKTTATVLNNGEKTKFDSIGIRRGEVTILRLNDGPVDGDKEGKRFTVDLAMDKRVPVPSTNYRTLIKGEQAIDSNWMKSRSDGRWGLNGEQRSFGLVSGKETESLHLELEKFDSRLNLDMVARTGEHTHLPTRAAAISATQILTHKAALYLDVSPDEFETLEPRLHQHKPILQIADALINGSGLCRRLAEPVTTGDRPLIVKLLHEILEDKNSWPLVDFLEKEHPLQCQIACYKCIQRYGNRQYHGLLDWRLGMAYLRSMVMPEFACGLNSNDWSYPEMKDWKRRAFELAADVESLRPGTIKLIKEHSLPILTEIQGGKVLWKAVVIHPLWKGNDELIDTVGLAGSSSPLRFIDTFELERRPLRALANLK